MTEIESKFGIRTLKIKGGKKSKTKIPMKTKRIN